MKWGWLFQTYVQWHAVAFVISELCTRTLGPEIDETWKLLDSVFVEWGNTITKQNKGLLWKPIRKLMVKARQARHKALEKAMWYPSDGSLGPAGPTMGSLMPLPESLRGESVFKGFPPQMDDKTQLDAFGVPVEKPSQTDSVMDALSFDLDPADPWILNDPTLLQDTEGSMTWESWDDMVKDFSMETMQDQALPLSMGSWW